MEVEKERCPRCRLVLTHARNYGNVDFSITGMAHLHQNEANTREREKRTERQRTKEKKRDTKRETEKNTEKGREKKTKRDRERKTNKNKRLNTLCRRVSKIFQSKDLFSQGNLAPACQQTPFQNTKSLPT